MDKWHEEKVWILDFGMNCSYKIPVNIISGEQLILLMKTGQDINEDSTAVSYYVPANPPSLYRLHNYYFFTKD